MIKKPNMIFIFSDQQRWDTVGSYGQELKITPNLDRLAEKGVCFKNIFTCQPVCGPARSCIQTGKYATQTGCYRNSIALPQNEKTIANWFSEAGYEVGYIGKWHLASTTGKSYECIEEEHDYRKSAIPFNRRGGYKDYWLASDVLEFTSNSFQGHLFNNNMEKVEFSSYRIDAITDFVIDYLKTRDGKKPFFLYTSYVEPHQQNNENRVVGPEGSKKKYGNYAVPEDLKDTEGDWQKNYPDYLGCCARLDYSIRRILNELEKLGLSNNTIIFYNSDHGCHFKTRNKDIINGYDDYKRSCHESSIRVPLIAYGPGFNSGIVVNGLVSSIDIPPTLLQCAGIKKPNYMQGFPLQGLLNGNVKNWREEVFIQISESQVGRAIRTKKWKYSVRAPEKDGRLYASSDIYIDDFLYDLENDPYEKNNLVDNIDFKDVKNWLRNKLKERMVKANEKEPEIKDKHV